MKNWFRQFPFYGWLIVILVLLVGNIFLYHHEQRQYTKQWLTERVQQDFHQREQTLQLAYKAGWLSPPINKKKLAKASANFYVLVLQNDTPIYWNDSKLPNITSIDLLSDSFHHAKIKILDHGVYEVQKITFKDSVQKGFTFIPIAYRYNNANSYFQSHFVATDKMPLDVTLGQKGIPIYQLNKKVAFHLHFKTNPTQLFKIDIKMGILYILLLIAVFVWVYKTCLVVSEKKRPIVGWLILAFFTTLVHVYHLLFDFPIGFQNTAFFSPEILASGSGIHSFPDLLLFVLLDFMLLFYLVKNVSIKKIKLNGAKVIGHGINIIIIALLFFEMYYTQTGYGLKLTMDSKLSFLMNDLQNVSIYSFLGLGVICLVVLNFVFLVSILKDLLQSIFKKKIWVYITFLIAGILWLAWGRGDEMIEVKIATLLTSLVALWVIDQLGLPIEGLGQRKSLISSPKIYVWFVILCAWATGQIFYYSFYKEKELRKVFAGQEAQPANPALLTYSFKTLSQNLRNDRLIQSFWEHPRRASSDNISRYIKYNYMGGEFKRFKANVYFFNRFQEPLYPDDSSVLPLLERAEKISEKGNKTGLIRLNNTISQNKYWGMIPIYSRQHQRLLGYIGIDWATNNNPTGLRTEFLLQEKHQSVNRPYISHYSYAVYKNHLLTSQDGVYKFPLHSYYNAKNKKYNFKWSWPYSTLFYKNSPEELVIVRFKRNVGARLISLFSYILFIWIFLFGLLFITNYFLKNEDDRISFWKNRLDISIRAKVNWTIMLTVLLSLIVVGGLTITYLKSRYQQSRRQDLQNLMFYFGQSIVHFIENYPDSSRQNVIFKTNQNPDLVYLLNALSMEQGVNINLYTKNGRLRATSQSALLSKGYLSGLMEPAALEAFATGNKNHWYNEEKIGLLPYQSLYLPLRNKDNQTIGYLNLPYYSSEKNIKAEVSGIVSTMINIYMLIFFIAGIMALLITNSIVRSFYLLIEQFRKIRLEDNTFIQWPYQDELRLLVNEYNAMILKVEQMATRLANTEREAAWRELALQVAHEIKNPLTPMKLNVQYLQKAIKSGNENVPTIAEKISKSLIEQIENLNIIASEFSQFAKLPKAKPEKIEVTTQIQSIVNLFQKEGVEVLMHSTTEQDVVYMDKSYFIRVFSNLIKNAIQAMPAEREHSFVLIKVETKRRNRVIISVKDNGSGIPEDVQKKIFTPYFTTKSSGTGIGLAMTKNMVELAGGKIDFTSIVGKGTIFWVKLPIYFD